MNEAMAAVGGILLLIVFCVILYVILNMLSDALAKAFFKAYFWINNFLANRINKLSDEEKARWHAQLNSHDEKVK